MGGSKEGTAMTRDILNFVEISERLGTGGQPTAEQLSALAREGYEIVINLALPTSDNAIPNEGELVTRAGMTYVHLPVKFDAPTERDLTDFRGLIRAFAGRKVFVHCALNMRVSAFVFLQRVLDEQLPVGNAAVDLHRVWEPDEVWRDFIARMLARP
jgi:protein tyrosine phosphatase (PTP) superfamily phosphohydrolase (DUF442 family)